MSNSIALPQHNVVDRYKEGYEALLEQYEHKTSRQKYAKNTEYVKFRGAIYVSFTYYPCESVSSAVAIGSKKSRTGGSPSY